MYPIMGKDDNSSKNLERTTAEQANKIATLENELKKTQDPNAGPKIIQKGAQLHPKYQRNNKKIAATLPKVTAPKA